MAARMPAECERNGRAMRVPHFRFGFGKSPERRPVATMTETETRAETSIEAEVAKAAPLAPFSLKALRIADEGWGAQWALEPAPMRRAWMDAQPYAYQCPPLAVANQWSWQILCPADVL